MFEALSKVRELILTTPIRSVDNVVSYYKNKAEYDFSLDLKDEDYGYKLNIDDINIFTNKHGKDMDNFRRSCVTINTSSLEKMSSRLEVCQSYLPIRYQIIMTTDLLK